MDKLIKKAKEILENQPFLYRLAGIIFGPITRHRERVEKAQKAAYFHAHALEALKAFVDCMEAGGFKYTLAFGSILGAIREHGFIKHDIDIDTSMWIDDFSPEVVTALEKAGFTWLFCNLVDDGRLGREDTFEYNGVRIDIFYFYPAIDTYPYCCDFVLRKEEKGKFMARRIEVPYKRERKKTHFEGIEVYIPENAEEICQFRYGPNYMTPDPSWNWVNELKHLVEWKDKLDVTTHNKYPHGQPATPPQKG